MEGKLGRMDFDSINGSQQGALSAGIGHNAAVQPFYEQADTEIGLV